MAIEKIEARNTEIAMLKAQYVYEKGQAKLSGGQLDPKRSKSLLASIEFGKFQNSFDIFDLKFDRWTVMLDGGNVDPVPFAQLLGELRHLDRKLDQFSETL